MNSSSAIGLTKHSPSSHSLRIVFYSVAIVAVAAFALAAESDAPKASADVTGTDLPQSRKETVQVMVEMSEPPAAALYAKAFKEARAQADAKRTYALAHPNAIGSQDILRNPKKVEIGAAAANEVKSHVQKLKQAQEAILPSLTGANVGGSVLYSVQRAYNGIAMIVSPNKISEIAQLPGVKAVHPLYPKYPSATFSDIDFLRTRTAGPNGGLWTTGGVLGENIKIADIDSGLDYVHSNFGGNGDYTGVTDTNPNGHFPSVKVPGGFDFVGDSYNATSTSPDFQPIPHPDENPFDGDPSGSVAGHGTGTASLIAGTGENNDGTTYTGTYDATNPDIGTLKISPGFAPKALLYPLRVFGNSGGSLVVTEAIEWAMDPNGDEDFSDHMDVINMSLGSNEGYADDPDAIAASNAAAIGILVCSAAGNAGDSYYIHSSPAAASNTLSVAATFNDQAGFVFDATVTGNAPPGFAGQTGFSIYTTTSPHTSATGDVVYAVNAPGPTGSTHDGSSPLTNAAQCVGKIVLVDRVPGQGANASVNCQNAGAIGILDVADNLAGGDPFLLTTSPALTKPMVVIPTAYGNAIKAAAGFDSNGVSTSSPPVNVTIAPGNGVVTHGGAAPDTIPSYSARGPGLPDSRVKPDLSAPAEVTGVAVNRTGTHVANFNGTSSSTPHVSGMMALLRQLHPTWSVQELNALACNTATHDLFTTAAHTTKYGVGRAGAGRIDLTYAANANVIAFNGTDPDLLGVSFGVVETPVNGTSELTKDITVKNNGTANVTYNLTIQNNPALAGTSFSFPNGTSFTVNAGGTGTVPVKFTATGNMLKHAREASVAAAQATVFGNFARHWLTEAAGYAVLTPDDGSPVLRVALYAAPKPVAAMHTTATSFMVNPGSSGTVQLPLAGTPVNTGTSFPIDIIGLVKPFELQYVGTGPSTDANKLRYVGVMSDFGVNGNKPGDTTITFGLEGFGDAAIPEFNSSDKEIFIDTNHDNDFDFAIFVSSLQSATSTAHTNVYFPFVVDLHKGTVNPFLRTNVLSPAARDTNSFNNSAILIPVPAAALLPAPSQGAGAPTKFRYVVATFDRSGDLVDQTPLMSYDVANPGFGLAGGHVEPFFYNDLPTTSIPVQYNAKNFKSNGSLGVWLVHMHNGDGLRSDVVPFTTK